MSSAYDIARRVRHLLWDTVKAGNTGSVESSALVDEAWFTMSISGEGKFRVTVKKVGG